MSIRLQGVDRPSTVNVQSSTPHGAWHLADNPNIYEPQRSNHFDVVVTGLENLQRAGTIGTEGNAFFPNAQESIRIAVAGGFVPHYTQSVININRGNTQVKFAGPMTFGNGTIPINDYIGANTKEILLAWQNLSGNVYTEKVGLAEDYKKECYLIEYTPDFQVVRRWILHGCWISGISEDPYSSDNGDSKRTITATIEYDYGVIDTSGDAPESRTL